MTPTIQLFFPRRALQAALAVAALATVVVVVRQAILPVSGKKPAIPPVNNVKQTIPPVDRQDCLSRLSSILIPDSTRGTGWMSTRFRLAGTVIENEETGFADESLAIIDDRTAVRQTVARAGAEIIPGITLAKINARSIVLSSADGDEEIFMERMAHVAAPPRNMEGERPREPNGTRAHYANVFGGREVFPGRWEYDRDAVLDYYNELRDDPERLLVIFDSLDPNWISDDDDDDDPLIDGYLVNIKGEPDFFAAAGLKEGDRVISVNNMHMSNRLRAEGLISGFIRGEATTFIFEIERDGKIEKQAYVIE